MNIHKTKKIEDSAFPVLTKYKLQPPRSIQTSDSIEINIKFL